MTLYSWLSPYNGDSGTLDSTRGIMFIILAAIGIAWIDALITFVFELGYVVVRHKFRDYVRLLRSKAFFRIMPAALFAGPLGLVPFAIASRYSVSVATSISAFYPALGSIIAMFWFKEKLTPVKFMGILFSIAGVVVISGFSGLHPVGIFLAVFASVGYSLELVFGYRLMAEDVDSDVSLALKQTSAIALYTIMLAVLLLIPGNLDFFTNLVRMIDFSTAFSFTQGMLGNPPAYQCRFYSGVLLQRHGLCVLFRRHEQLRRQHRQQPEHCLWHMDDPHSGSAAVFHHAVGVRRHRRSAHLHRLCHRHSRIQPHPKSG